VWITLLPTLIVINKRESHQFNYRDYVGWSLWVIGMAIEVIADFQKYNFRYNPINK